jgi:hypothetical protein
MIGESIFSSSPGVKADTNSMSWWFGGTYANPFAHGRFTEYSNLV